MKRHPWWTVFKQIFQVPTFFFSYLLPTNVTPCQDEDSFKFNWEIWRNGSTRGHTYSSTVWNTKIASDGALGRSHCRVSREWVIVVRLLLVRRFLVNFGLDGQGGTDTRLNKSLVLVVVRLKLLLPVIFKDCSGMHENSARHGRLWNQKRCFRLGLQRSTSK